MQTHIANDVKNRPEHQELEDILRSCVHCGFCNATCPTYQLLGDELDGPRGRIYLLKQMLEGNEVSRITQLHLDRCLTCRSCETTCPSGVRYGRLLDIGREMVETRVGRTFRERIIRNLIRFLFPDRDRFALLMRIARLVNPLLPESVQHKIHIQSPKRSWPRQRHKRIMLSLPGCVQNVIASGIDISAAHLLDKQGISLVQVEAGGCCGALNYHLADHGQAIEYAKRNIDACWPYIEQGAEAIVMTASGCGVMTREYHELFRYDEDYAEKAARFSSITKDISEILHLENATVSKNTAGKRVAFHSPCTLQHGQKVTGFAEAVLIQHGYTLIPVEDSHLCCGSAGVYSMLQPELSGTLLQNKLKALHIQDADMIATANIGCLTHLQAGCDKQVVHWIELL